MGDSVAPVPSGQTWVVVIRNETGPGRPILSCVTKVGDQRNPCFCTPDKGCSGSDSACGLFKCNQESSCWCGVQNSTSATYLLGTAGVMQEFLSFKLLIYHVCADPMRVNGRKRRDVRSPLPEIRINGSTLHASEPGRLILRKHGLTHTARIGRNHGVPLPKEFTIFDGELFVALISDSGNVTTEEFNLLGLTPCEELGCLFCAEAIQNLHCLPPFAQYVVYGVGALTALVFVTFCRSALRLVVEPLGGLAFCLRLVYRLCKGTLRLCLRIGRVGGLFARANAVRIQNRAVVFERRVRDEAMNMAIILAFVVFFAAPLCVEGICQSNSVIQSDSRDCVGAACFLKSKSEATISSIGSSACLEYRDGERVKLRAKITLQSVTCAFKTTTEYFTFETYHKSQSALYCPNDGACAWLANCRKNFKQVPALEPFHSNTTIYGCVPTRPRFLSKDHCFIIHVDACLFYTAMVLPRYETAMEVKRIDSYKCFPNAVLDVDNGGNSSDVFVLNDGQVNFGNLSVEFLGSFDRRRPAAHQLLIVLFCQCDQGLRFLESRRCVSALV